MGDRKAVVVYEQEHKQILKDILGMAENKLKNCGCDVLLMEVSADKKGYEYYTELEKYDADYLLSFAMAGFQWDTLTGQVSYNRLYAKQIHILIGDYEVYEEYLQKEFAINLFFFADNAHWIKDWKTKYTGVPFMEKIPTIFCGEKLSVLEKEQNKKIICYVIDKVIAFTEGKTEYLQ